MDSPPRSPPGSDFRFHVDPLQHPSDPSVVPGQNGIAISALEPSTLSAIAPPSPASSGSSSSPAASASPWRPPVPKFSLENSSSIAPPLPGSPNSLAQNGIASSALEASPSEILAHAPASVSRKLPPVPKFGPSDTSSMGPPPSKPSVLPRGLMGPPPVPKFQSSSGEKNATAPPASHAPPSASSASATGEQSSSPEDAVEAAELPSVSNSDCPTGIGGKQAVVVNLESGALALAAGCGANDGAGQMNGAAVEGRKSSVAEDGSKSEIRSAAAGSGINPSQPPYLKPSWSAAPGQPYTLEILKEGHILAVEDVSKKGAYMFGRSDRCDFVLEHPTISRYHAVLQYNADGESFLFDLGSTHGTFINKVQVKGKEYVPLHVGDIVRFGYSSRLHAFQGPLNLMPQEGLSMKERQAQRLIEAVQDRAIREASLVRGKRDSLTADGISWGMQEDAEEEEEENAEEITWQTFKGELTEKQQKTLDKIHKHNEKLSNLKKENDAIQAKEISQGGLTQGQQTQVARNDQRMEQLVEDVESLEETLNESIQESISGRTGRPRRGKKNPLDEDEEDDFSDDEFYDRASKLQPQKRKETVQKVETAESLLDKKAALAAEIETLHEAIKMEEEHNRSSSQEAQEAEMVVPSEDPLDQFMTNLSTTILKDRTSHLQKELDSLTKELERVERLLKIADPIGDGYKKWELKRNGAGQGLAETMMSKVDRRIFPRKEDTQELATSISDVEGNVLQKGSLDAIAMTVDNDGAAVNNTTSGEDNMVLPGLEPPVRLGAPVLEEAVEVKVEFSDKVNDEALTFVTYKDRKKTKGGMEKGTDVEVVKKHEVPEISDKKEEVSEVDGHVAEYVALLLRHKRGLVTEDNEVLEKAAEPSRSPITSVEEEKTPSKTASKKRKKQGPAKLSPSDMDNTEDWVPPAGQTGDGRTALNDKYGY